MIPRPKIAEIQQSVCEAYGLDLIEMRSRRRRDGAAEARALAMYLSRRLTDHSFPAIARMFGKADHSTVVRACDKIEERSGRDPDLSRRANVAIAKTAQRVAQREAQ